MTAWSGVHAVSGSTGSAVGPVAQWSERCPFPRSEIGGSNPSRTKCKNTGHGITCQVAKSTAYHVVMYNPVWHLNYLNVVLGVLHSENENNNIPVVR